MHNFYTKNRTFIELALTILIFGYLIFIGEILKKTYFHNIIYAILSFIVILELTKMLGEYIFDRDIKIDLILDAFFIFTLRETILVYTNETLKGRIEIFQLNTFVFSINEKLFYIIIGILIMMTLIHFRLKYKLVQK